MVEKQLLFCCFCVKHVVSKGCGRAFWSLCVFKLPLFATWCTWLTVFIIPHWRFPAPVHQMFVYKVLNQKKKLFLYNEAMDSCSGSCYIFIHTFSPYIPHSKELMFPCSTAQDWIITGIQFCVCLSVSLKH